MLKTFAFVFFAGFLASASNRPIDIVVIMKAQTDLRPAALLATPLSRRAFIAANLARTAAVSQASLQGFLNQKNLRFQSYSILNAIRIPSASPELIGILEQRSDVRKIIPDVKIVLDRPLHVESRMTASSEIGANITATGAEDVWAQGFQGQGIVVASQDTGVDWTHPALMPNYRGANGVHEFSWHDAIHSGKPNRCGFDSKVPCDDTDHGTHTVGTMIGEDGIGMAPKAKWIACRNMDAGYGSPSTFIECYQWMLAPGGDASKAPNIINNSWICDQWQGCQGEELVPILKVIHDAGIMNVVAAGNNGPNCGTIKSQPASISPYSLVVGAYDHRNGELARFSARGPSPYGDQLAPDLTAPGVTIRSSIPGGGFEDNNFSGTSMAGPHVAGAVALLWSAQPNLVGQVDQTIQLLRDTATPVTDPGHNCGSALGRFTPNNSFGYGILNVKAAVAKARAL